MSKPYANLSHDWSLGRPLVQHFDGKIVAYVPTPYRHNHAPTMVELRNGDLLLAWFAGNTEEGRADIKIALSRLKAGELQWSSPVLISEDYTKSEQNPILQQLPDGRVLLMYTAQDAVHISSKEYKKTASKINYSRQETAHIRCRISEDFGESWGPVETFSDTPGSFCRSPMIKASNGDLLFPMWYSTEDSGLGNDYSVVRISSDEGATWSEYPIPNSRGRVHASIVEWRPGELLAFMRSRAADNIYVSRSQNFGQTWSIPERTVLPNNNASIRALQLQSGRIAIISNHFRGNDDPALTVWPGVRYPVTIALSEDGGITWPHMRHIETGDGFCGEDQYKLNRKYEYPWLIQSQDGFLHASFAYGSRTGIQHIVITEDWVMGHS
ncbi:exo-alpha-sialidase [Paenibacillus sp. J5C_2022]|uniref:sialidase family protein n=1 Tax=Paenibacillus sp. J5C2022 TaxID=2977129 RepID=UPI0021D2E4D9|nr:sialidase family protein [Paenibacillus sp. J5C2022]MCU6712909.1 exo-alpha-sialidase [Paenibacillus sp. J5C2022]